MDSPDNVKSSYAAGIKAFKEKVEWYNSFMEHMIALYPHVMRDVIKKMEEE